MRIDARISRHAFFEFKLFVNYVSGEVMMRWQSTRRRWMSIPPTCRDSTLLAIRRPSSSDALYFEAEITSGLSRLESSRMNTSVQVRLLLVVRMVGPHCSSWGKQLSPIFCSNPWNKFRVRVASLLRGSFQGLIRKEPEKSRESYNY